MLAAIGRIAHLFAYGPRALVGDWLAWPLLGSDAEALLEMGRGLIGEYAIDYATWHAARTHFSEDWLIASQARQYVILGAGLDSFAWRQAGDLQVYEFDHPATQRWKRGRLEKLGVPIPSTLTMVEADFEHESVEAVLRDSALDVTLPIFVSWLGVLPYLTPDAIVATLDALPRCTIAVSYGLPESRWDPMTRPFATRMMHTFAEMGEPLLTMTTPEQTADLLRRGGFEVEEDLGPVDVTNRYAIPCIGHERIVLARKPS
jgi:methyltransferase (TIGR00027 family)